MIYQRLEILIKASRMEAIEFIEGQNANLEGEFYKLLRSGYIIEIDKPFNSSSFQDSSGHLHSFKYVKITQTGLDLFKELIKEVKRLKKEREEHNS